MNARRARHLCLAAMPNKTLANIGLVDDPEKRPIRIADRDQHAPGRRAGDKTPRAVNGVQNPGEPGGPFRDTIFFAQDGVVGAFARQDIAHGPFGRTIGFSDGIIAGLEFVVRNQICLTKMG